MQRSSEAIGAIAAALAKAQAELTNPEKAFVATIRSGLRTHMSGIGRSDTPPFPGASILCARPSAAKRLRLSRRLQSTEKRVSFVLSPPSRTRPESGCRRTGQSARSAKPPLRDGWERRLPTRVAIRFSPWSGSPVRTTLTRQTLTPIKALKALLIVSLQ